VSSHMAHVSRGETGHGMQSRHLVDIDVSDVCAEPLGIEVGMHTWSNIRDDVVLLPPSQNAERLRKAGQRET
jgi:hypothetical protein